MTQAAATDGLSDLMPLTRTVQAGGMTVEVAPIAPRQLAPVVKALAPLQAAIGNGLDITAVPRDKLLDLVGDHADNAIALVASATRLPYDFVADQINLAELLDLVVAVIEVHADFFARRMVPALLALMARMPRTQAGPMPSSDL